jgi:uncharacterized protein with HEPN domain
MRQNDPRPWLHDILEAIVGARGAVGDMTLDAYVASWTTRRAAERAIEIISEATRHLPERLRASEPDVPWREIASIDNVLRHAYHRGRRRGDLRDRDPPARAAGYLGTEAARSCRGRQSRLRAGTGESSAGAN